MKTCLVNLAYLDPATIGGVGRIAREVSHLLATETDGDQMRVVFIVGWRFAGAFAAWLGCPAVVVPFQTRFDFAITVRILQPDVVVSPLFGLEPFQDVTALQIAGMPDALALDHSELFSPVDLAYRQQVYANLSKAFRVVTLSEHARTRLLHHTVLSDKQVVVIPLGADPQAPPAQAVPLKLPPRYVMYPANMWPHKRHDLLMKIMNAVWARQPDIHLVLTGGRSAADKERLSIIIAQNACPPERIHDLGFVADDQLTVLYRHAEAVLFVSQYEGFGMPLLEAMQQGCPVICAPEAAIPEVVGDAGLFVGGEDPVAWADALLQTLPAQRAALVMAGRMRAAQYTWAQTRSRWRDVLVQGGAVFRDSPAPSASVSAVAHWSQPLLKRISTLATRAGRGRLRRVMWMPILLVLQVCLLWGARTFIQSPS